MEIISIIIGVIIGGVAGLLIGRSKGNVFEAKAEMLKAQAEEDSRQHEAAVAALRQQHEQTIANMRHQHEQTIANMREQHENFVKTMREQHEQTVASMREKFDETIEKVSAQMKNATADMLKERQKEFAESSHQNIGQIVTPLRETIEQMRKAMDDSTIKQTAMSGEMKATIENMMRQSQAAKESADELTRVFKHGSKVQGDWGETVLDELLQSQGLTRGIHYDTQAVIKDAAGNVVRTHDGTLMRPDVIMHLDERRELIIDSKVSLTAFMDYANAENEEDRQRFLKLHIDSIQKHVKELSAKDYSSYIQPPKVKMDYVIMFVPHIGALWTALNAQPDLWRKAMEKNVFIADEQTLFAALRIINLTWTQIRQAQNHERVYELANEMIDRVGQFAKKYESIGKAIAAAQKAYDDGERKLVPQGQSIIQTANKLIKLGAKQSDRNPLPQLEPEQQEIVETK